MNKNLLVVVVLVLIIIGGFVFNKDKNNNMEEQIITTPEPSDIAVTPIEHATMMLKWAEKIIYTDPVGGASAFIGLPEPDLVLVTDIHGDHLNVETLQAVVKEKTTLVMPQAVADEIKVTLPGKKVILANGQSSTEQGFSIEAIPMYNLPESADSYHVKGRGNGYVISAVGKRVYIAGDTEGIPEMRNLKNIDLAFIPMNLPYTMTVEEAADAVIAFKPKTVTPYHYRGQDGLADTTKFRDLVNAGDPNIAVDLMDFYPKE